jgi:UDP-glucuronate 4-epimerase
MNPQKHSPRIAFVTGAAGFIGFHIVARLLDEGWRVIGLDSLNAYYDPSLKERRRSILIERPGFSFVHGKLEDAGLLMRLFEEYRPNIVIHLAAQAGVRYSIENPRAYVEANLLGTFELLEAARAYPPEHMLMASTSSVFGANTQMPYAETDKADSQMSFYAATKKANEAMSHSYAHIHGLPVTMFRFFTVYGPWGRPDMALFKFVSAIRDGTPIDVYNHGNMKRDFTYIDDLVEALVRLINVAPHSPDNRGEALSGDSLSAVAPWRVVNIGNSNPVMLRDFIAAIEAAVGQTAEKNFMPMQPGDVPATWADTRLLNQLIGEMPQTPLQKGVQAFVDWYAAEKI